MDPTVNEEALERALATIEGARSWSPRVVSRLEHQVRAARDEDLFRLNPLTWASERGVDEYEAWTCSCTAPRPALSTWTGTSSVRAAARSCAAFANCTDCRCSLFRAAICPAS